MKLKLLKGKQKELILLAKGRKSWNELGNIVGISPRYLSRDLRYERVLVTDKLYKHLCKISDSNFDHCILENLENNWGKSKGGLVSRGSTKLLPYIKQSKKLAEFTGAVLGDGNICFLKESNEDREIGTYCVRIAGDLRRDREYHLFLKKLSKEIFNLEGKIVLYKKKNERFLSFSSKELVNFLIFMGVKSGDKIKNRSIIPEWIFRNNSFLRSCLRGLIDTDGCVHKMSKKDPMLIRINFKNYNPDLLNSVREGFIKLGYNPSKITNNNVFYISRQKEIQKYLKEINFSNKKHLDRLKSFKSPVF